MSSINLFSDIIIIKKPNLIFISTPIMSYRLFIFYIDAILRTALLVQTRKGCPLPMYSETP